jgi:hypothetical protein
VPIFAKPCYHIPIFFQQLFNYSSMRKLKKIIRLLHLLLFGFMLAVCIVMGVAPFIPKRKQEFTVEIKMEETEKKEETTACLVSDKKQK